MGQYFFNHCTNGRSEFTAHPVPINRALTKSHDHRCDGII